MSKEQLGQLFIISAPSGAGKTSLIKALLEQAPDLALSISCTTRPIRPGETNGEDYFFVDQKEFEHLQKSQALLEYAQVFDHYYGTPKAAITEKRSAGIDVLLEIDWQGAAQIRKLMPDAISIFILPPSHEILRERLEYRQQDTPETIAKRLDKARQEIVHYSEYDFLIINDDFQRALTKLNAIVTACRLKTTVQKTRHAELIAKLLAH